MYVERVGQLQRALSSLQASSDRREETERQLRGQLEKELREGGGGGGGGNGNELTSNGETIADLKRRLRERDEKIMSLEGDVAKWEQRYLEESALRQAAIDAASLPKWVQESFWVLRITLIIFLFVTLTFLFRSEMQRSPHWKRPVKTRRN